MSSATVAPAAKPVRNLRLLSAFRDFLSRWFVFNSYTDKTEYRIVAASQAAVLFAAWYLIKLPFLPQPPEIASAFKVLWMEHGLAQNWAASLVLMAKALAVSTVVSLTLSYLHRIPWFRPAVESIAALRFLGLMGLLVFFILLFGSGQNLKLAVVVFAESVFMIRNMVDEIRRVTQERYDHPRTLRMNELRVTYETVVLGTLPAAFDNLRQNAAIGWTMLTVVEGFSRAEGGLGAMLLNENKHFKLEGIVAICLCILLTGICQDQFIKWLKSQVCPWSNMNVGRS